MDQVQEDILKQFDPYDRLRNSLRMQSQRRGPQTREVGATNKDYARDNSGFADACLMAGLEPTSRQASKYRNGRGAAYKVSRMQKFPAMLEAKKAE